MLEIRILLIAVLLLCVGTSIPYYSDGAGVSPSARSVDYTMETAVESAPAIMFSQTINLSKSPGFSGFHKSAVSGNNVYVVWHDDSIPFADVFFRRSTDSGATFDPVMNLSNNPPKFSRYPQIAASGSYVYVVWQDKIPSGNTEIFFRRSTDSGATFDPVMNLSNNAGFSSGDFFDGLQIAAAGSNVYVVWEDDTPGNYEVFFRASTNNGATFDPVMNLSNNAGVSAIQSRSIVAAGSSVYVAWQDLTLGSIETFFRASTNSGATFDPVMNLSNNAGGSGPPVLAASGNSVYVTWSDLTPGNNEIFFKRSTNNGATFDPVMNLSNNAGTSGNPQIAVSGVNVYIVWQDNSLANNEVFFIRSANQGTTFGVIRNLSNNAGASVNPQVAASGSSVYGAWQDNTGGNYDVKFFKESSSNGVTFNSRITLSNNSGSSEFPQVAASDSNVYVAWRDNTPGNTDVFFRAS